MVQCPAQQSGREEKEAETVNPARLLRQHLQSLSAAGLSHLPHLEVHDSAPTSHVTALEAPAASASDPSALSATTQSSRPDATPAKTPTKAEMAPVKAAPSKIESSNQPR